MAKRRPLPSELSIGDSILMDAKTVQHVLDISLSTLLRLERGESVTATPFPKPFKPYGRTLNWESAAIQRWVAEKLAAAE